MDQAQIKAVVEKTKRLDPKSLDEIREPLRILKSHECWASCQELLEKLLQKPDCSKSVYFEYIKILTLHFQEPTKASLLLQRLAQQHKVTFTELSQEIFSESLSEASASTKAVFFEKTASIFPRQTDQVLCLEQAFELYEKKLHDDVRTMKIAERLLKLEPTNLIALNHMRGRAFAEGQWVDVAAISEKILAQMPVSESRGRQAYQLANIYLNQLHQAKKALETITKFGEACPIEQEPLMFEAYSSLRDWQGCLSALNSLMKKTDTKREQAKINFQLGLIYERLGKLEEAEREFQMALDRSPSMVAPIEHLVQIHINQQNKKALIQCLGQLRTRLTKNQMIQRIDRILSILASDY